MRRQQNFVDIGAGKRTGIFFAAHFGEDAFQDGHYGLALIGNHPDKAVWLQQFQRFRKLRLRFLFLIQRPVQRREDGSGHPTGQSIKAGETAVFSVTAEGEPSPDYQWQVSTDSGVTWTNITDGGIYSGTATDTLTLTGVRGTHSGYQYRCVVSNPVQDGVQSGAATLTITDAAPVLIATPQNLSFGEVTVGAASTQQTVTVSGINLSDAIDYAITGAGAGAFQVSENSWTATGGTLHVTFTPTAVKEYSAALTLTSSDAAPVTVSLTGSGKSSGGAVTTYTLSYDAGGADGGSLPADPAGYPENTAITVADNTGGLWRSGYDFAGWHCSLDNKIYNVGDTFRLTGNATLTARWNSQSSGGTSSGSGGSDTSAPKTRIPTSAFSWDDGRTLTIDHENITVLDLLRVEWDGKEVRREDYTVASGSVIIRFGQNFIAAQKPGRHTIRVEFDRYYGEYTILLTKDTPAAPSTNNAGNGTLDLTTGGFHDNPQTGDTSPWWVLVPVVVLAAGVSFVICRRENKKGKQGQ